MAQDLTRISAWYGAREIVEKRMTTAVWVRALLERVEARDPQIRAWAHLDAERALAWARERDRDPRGSPLNGVPFGIKDIIDTVDLPTEYGSPIYRGYRPGADAACVAL